MKNTIGIHKEKATQLAQRLNNLLANYQVFYMNTRAFHWNIKGRNFFELHVKFEELYNDLLIKVDEIAERILTLDATPMHTFTDYLKMADVKETNHISDGDIAVQNILDSFKTLLIKQRELLTLASDAEDEGTSALMSDYIREQEKLVWMYSSFMN